MLRVTPELERSHDLVMQVAGRAGLAAPGRNLTPRARDLAARMGDLAGGMWRQAANAWHQRDRGAAAALAGRARELDELHAALAAELAAGQVTTPVAMEMTLVARCYQRLGAHAVNIARRAGYLAGSAGG
ncbi:MAG TPA: PhoU domain-containing protein [Streptosporangiaceae bacterium]